MGQTTIDIECARCGAVKTKIAAEVRRSLGLGRSLFCSRTCSGKSANDWKRSVEFKMECPVCGDVFTTSTHNKAKKHCSRSCASKGSMTEERREAQRKSGLEHTNNLISTAEVLKKREAWKYAALKEYLGNRPHEFEYALGGRVFDLALFDVKVLVEFDGPNHFEKVIAAEDAKKDHLAKTNGWTVVRCPVRRSVVIDPSTIEGV